VHSYDEVVERVARRIDLDDPSKIRLTSHNCYSQQPKPQPIKYRGVERLSDMLVHYNQACVTWIQFLHCSLSFASHICGCKLFLVFFFFFLQTSDILYYEVLDLPLPELQGLKNLKVAFHHTTKDEVRLKSITITFSMLFSC
jgi:ubiquitin carboxyl-terminal hydrolase 7